MLLFLALALNAEASSLQFKGRIETTEGGGKGEVTIDASTIEVEARRAFSKESFTVKLNDAKSLRVTQNLFKSTVQMSMKDGSTVLLTTSRKYYDDLKALLKGRIT